MFLIGAVILFREARGADAAEGRDRGGVRRPRRRSPKAGFAAIGASFLVLFAAEWGDLSQLLTALAGREVRRPGQRVHRRLGRAARSERAGRGARPGAAGTDAALDACTTSAPGSACCCSPSPCGRSWAEGPLEFGPMPSPHGADSEVGRLQTVMLHRPGPELKRLTPRNNDKLLFDGIPWIGRAQDEHDAFAQALRDRDVEVLYLVDLLIETLGQRGRPRARDRRGDVADAPRRHPRRVPHRRACATSPPRSWPPCSPRACATTS